MSAVEAERKTPMSVLIVASDLRFSGSVVTIDDRRSSLKDRLL
jgi:hypothetical protein